MMKQHLRYLFFLAALLGMATTKVYAYDAEIDGVYYNFNGDEAYVTNSELYVGNYAKYVGTVVIPEQVAYQGKKYKVTTIIESAFYHCTNEFIGVILPNTIISIGKKAFASCNGLTEIKIPNSVKTIEAEAFYGCENLQTVTAGNAIEYIGERCFQRCDKITSLNLPNTVSYIGAYALPPNLTSFNIPSSLKTLSKWFINSPNITSLMIPQGVTTIEEYAISCPNLVSISIPSSVTSISDIGFGLGYYAPSRLQVHITDLEAWLKIPFGVQQGSPNYETWTCKHPFKALDAYGKTYSLYLNGKELTDVIIPESFTTIPAFAFYNCGGIKTISMHNAVTDIKEGAFYRCGQLESVVIPNSVTKIGPQAFYRDTIQSLTIGSGVLEIGNEAFGFYSYSDCPINKTIWLTNTPPKNYEVAAGLINYVSNDQFTFKSSKKPALVYPLLSSMFAVDGVKYVPTSMANRTCHAIDAVYDESAALTKLSTTTAYRNVAFKVDFVMPYTCSGNTHIKNVELTDLPFINDNVFDGCTNLQSAKLPETVTELGFSAFKNCSSLREIAIPAAATLVRYNAFMGCTSLRNVTMNDGMEPLILAYNCGKLEVDYINNKVTTSGDISPLFSDCPLDHVYIGRNIVYGTTRGEGYSPFYRNTSLRSVEITDQETEISENEFYGCTGLKNVKIGNGVTTIANWAFSGCSSLKYFEFGSSMQTIGKEAFSDCTAVTRIYSHATTPPVCGAQALDDINKWECTLYVPDGNVAAYQNADQWSEFIFTESLSAGIEGVTVGATNNAPVFSLSGRRLTAPARGINIIGEKKVVIKR